MISRLFPGIGVTFGDVCCCACLCSANDPKSDDDSEDDVREHVSPDPEPW